MRGSSADDPLESTLPFFWLPAGFVLPGLMAPVRRPIAGPSYLARPVPLSHRPPLSPLSDLSGYDVSYVCGSYLRYKWSVC